MVVVLFTLKAVKNHVSGTVLLFILFILLLSFGLAYVSFNYIRSYYSINASVSFSVKGLLLLVINIVVAYAVLARIEKILSELKSVFKTMKLVKEQVKSKSGSGDVKQVLHAIRRQELKDFLDLAFIVIAIAFLIVLYKSMLESMLTMLITLNVNSVNNTLISVMPAQSTTNTINVHLLFYLYTSLYIFTTTLLVILSNFIATLFFNKR